MQKKRTEGNRLHHPPTGRRQGSACAVSSGGRRDFVFRNVTVRAGRQSQREPAAGDAGRLDSIASHQQVRCGCRLQTDVAARCAIPDRPRECVDRIDRINAAIFQDSNVRIGS